MIMNRLRGTVADRPIDSQVVQQDMGSAMHQINALQRQQYPVQQVDVGRAYPTYEKG